MTIRIANQFDLWPVDRLTPYERNSRLHPADQVAGIAASIREFGFIAPIVVDVRRDRIAAGHGRLMAARQLGMTEVPVIAVDHLTEAQFRAYVIADNKHTDNSTFDMEVLAAELAALAGEGFDLDPLGFTDDELAALLPEEGDDDDDAGPVTDDPDQVPEAPAEPTSRRGDLWRLGNHRLLCGDSTSQAETDVLMAGQQAVCLWTDPPYNVNYEGSAGKIMNDHMADEQFGQFLRAVFDNAAAHLVAGSVFFEDKPARNAEHPTMKPVGLIERMLANSTNPGDMVLDLFGGSGSTLIACERTKRVARVMELDPRFIDVIVQRWQDLTGRTARLEATGETFAELRARRAAEPAEASAPRGA